jgi:hypothetical protein
MEHFKQQPASQRTAAPQQAASGQRTSAQLSWHISWFFCKQHFKQQPASQRTAAGSQRPRNQRPARKGTSKGT